MAFSDLCHISNAYKSVENETDQSDRIMEENSMVRDLITKILDETGPSESGSSIQPPEKTLIPPSNLQYPKTDPGAFIPPYNYQEPYNFAPDQNGFNYLQNGFGNTNGFHYPEENLLMDPMSEAEAVTPEQLNLLRLAAQEIGGAQFTSPKYEDKFNYNFFENQRIPENNMFGYRTQDSSFNNFDYAQRYPNKFEQQNETDLLACLSQLQLNMNFERDVSEFKMPTENGYQNEDFNKMQAERNKMFFNRNVQLPPKQFNGETSFYEMMKQIDRPNFEFSPPNFKPNGYQNDFLRNQMVRENFQGNMDSRSFDQNAQQAVMRQNQELARQMSLLMRNRPPPNQLNVDVSFLQEHSPFNLGLGALLGPSPTIPPPVLPSPMLDLPLLAPFHTMRNIRGAATSSGILHVRLDACYEQWRQLERERKRTEARLALAYPGRAVSSSNSIPVPRLPPCPTRVDRLTVDMLREHTKVLTLMGKMETLRASVCVAQNKKPNKQEDGKITVLKRGQENVADKEKDGVDPDAFNPESWKEDVKNLSEIAPHSEVESAMLAWRSAVAAVQAARRRELRDCAAPHHPHHPQQHHPQQHHQQQQQHRHARQHADPILQLAEAVRGLCVAARRARCAMWCDLTLTVALAPHHHHPAPTPPAPATAAAAEHKQSEKSQTQPASPKQNSTEPAPNTSQGSKTTPTDTKEEKQTSDPSQKTDAKTETNNNKTTTANKQDKSQQKRTQNCRHKVNGRNDFYQKNQRYDNRFMQNRHPYYLATGPIN